MRNKNQQSRKLSLYGASVCFALLAGASPAALTLFVDPYEVYVDKNRTSKITDIAEKRHYPLWKLAHYKKGHHDTVILGDSRARSLKDKYWIELGVSKALNLAYGGGTIPEIYTTFNHIKNDPAIKNIVIGIQLRSFDEKHKGGLNRVPEAIRILDSQFEYVKNWSILNTAFDMFKAENKTTLKQINSYVPTLVSNANADELCTQPKRSICYNCTLPKNLNSVPYRIRTKGRNLGLGRGARYDGILGYMSNTHWRSVNELYTLAAIDTKYSKKITRQIKRNGKSDWKSFQFSKKYWNHIVEISNWAKANNKTITYIIPPTVQGMQNTIKVNLLAPLNHKFRIELAKLGNVYDFDFGNKITANGKNFTDAYHFNSKIARQIVGEVALSIVPTSKKKVLKRRGKIKCTHKSNKSKALSDAVKVSLFDYCRVWKEAKS